MITEGAHREWERDSVAVNPQETEFIEKMTKDSYQIDGDHYTKHKIQPWHIIDAYELGFYDGNVVKYILRDKGSRLTDLKKAAHYLDKLIEMEEAKPEDELPQHLRYQAS